MLEGTEKKTQINVISNNYLLRGALSEIRENLIFIGIGELIFLIIGLFRGNLARFLLVGLGVLSIVIYLLCKGIVKVISIKCGYITIKDDEITKTWIRTRGSEDIYFAHLKTSGKICLSKSEYMEMKQGDKMYVVEYGTGFVKDIYPQSYTRINQEMMAYYEG